VRGARNAELLRDLLRGEAGAKAEGFEPVADVVEADGPQRTIFWCRDNFRSFPRKRESSSF
jgi:hypothetical protein